MMLPSPASPLADNQARSNRSADERLIGLDVLRFFAIALVLGRHMELPPADWPALARASLLVWFRGGWVGVDLFFVLSGFLVSGLLFREYLSNGSFSPLRFYVRRGWRIYPAFFALIVATIALNPVFGLSVPASSLAAEVFFVQSYFTGLWGHTWSLAVEEHFYLLLPPVLAVLLRLAGKRPAPLRTVVVVALGVTALFAWMRLAHAYLSPAYSHLTHLFATHLRFDALALGVAISYAYHFQRAEFTRLLTPYRRALAMAGVALLLPAFLWELEITPFIYTSGLSLFAIGSAMILMSTLVSSAPGGRLPRLAADVGSQSYSIYLWHMPVAVWIVPLFVGALGYGSRLAIYLAGSITFGVLMARLIEAPTLRFRDRYFPARRADGQSGKRAVVQEIG